MSKLKKLIEDLRKDFPGATLVAEFDDVWIVLYEADNAGAPFGPEIGRVCLEEPTC